MKAITFLSVSLSREIYRNDCRYLINLLLRWSNWKYVCNWG